VIHAKELKRTTNTGRLGLRALRNSEMRTRGLSHEALDLSDLLTDQYRTLLFYPSEEAQELTPEFVAKSPLPIQLIVPDGSWRQASKVHYRHSELKLVERVMISTPNLGTQHLRAETTEYGMSTLEAMARALGVIEGVEVEEKLLRLYEAKLERTLKGRGTFKDSEA
jgi:DTW domain-containing protein YfiP